MRQYYYDNRWYTVNELSEISGIKPHTIRDRLRRGYPIEEAVKPMALNSGVAAFIEASDWHDWLDRSIDEVYRTYWEWSVNNEYSVATKQTFSRHLFSVYPNLKTMPVFRNERYYRLIKER